MHMSYSKDETLFFDQYFYCSFCNALLLLSSFIIGIYDKESRKFTNNRGSLAYTRSFQEALRIFCTERFSIFY